MENNHFERRAEADSFMSLILSVARLVDSFFSIRTEKLFAMPGRSSFLARMETLGGIMIN